MNDISCTKALNDVAILQEIGTFIKTKRIAQELTQKELSEKASISRSTLSLMELGKNTALINLIKVLRILDVLYVFETFKIEQTISPLQLAKEDAKKRKRASKKRNNNNDKKQELKW